MERSSRLTVPRANEGIATSRARSYEGKEVFWCKTSRTLCVSFVGQPLLMLGVDLDRAVVSNSFELLPNAVSNGVLSAPDVNAGHRMSASHQPYGIAGAWRVVAELPPGPGDGGWFRLLLEGKTTGTGSRVSKLILVEYSEGGVRCEELKWPMKSDNTGGAGVVGAAVFTAPTAVARQAPELTGELFVDRAALCLAFSNGVMCFWAEGGCSANVNLLGLAVCETSNRLCLESCLRSRVLSALNFAPPVSRAATPIERFDIACFEIMRLVPNSELEFGLGGEAGDSSASLRRKLSMHNGDGVVFPADGGCLRAGLVAGAGEEDAMICGIRVLVGSSSASAIPKKMTVMGRDVALVNPNAVESKSQLKRFYDVPLHKDEIIGVERLGFVPITVGPAPAGNVPVLDVVEV